MILHTYLYIYRLTVSGPLHELSFVCIRLADSYSNLHHQRWHFVVFLWLRARLLWSASDASSPCPSERRQFGFELLSGHR